MSTSCGYRTFAHIICIGIALDNGINTFYYLHLEHWTILSKIVISLSSLLLNGLLYHNGAAMALFETWQDFKNFIKKPKIKEIFPYLISLSSSYVMATFTVHSYIKGVINLPNIAVYLFSFCYFIGTHTLIIQAAKKNLAVKVIALDNSARIKFFIWFTLFMIATATAIPQWSSGIKFLDSNLSNALAFATYIGEAFFVGQLSIWLSKIKFNKALKPILPLVTLTASLNAIGFACMTEYDSWITTILSSNATFVLGFILSFFMMFKSLVELKK